MTEERQAVKTLAEELVKAMKSVNKTSSQKMGTSGTVLASKIVGLPAAFSSIISGIEESAAAGDAVAQQTLTALNHIAAGEFETITADTAMIDKVYATFGDFVNLIAENAVIGDLDVDSIRASMGVIGLLTLTTADIQQAQIEHLSADNAFLRYGVGGKLYIDDLAVSNANIVNLAAGTILLNDSNGDLVELYVDATTGDVTTRAVSYDGSDIINQNSLNGNRIVQNSITTTQLNASEIFAYQGMIMDLIADNIEATRLFANQGFIQQLQTTIISSDLSSNPSFISLADSINLVASNASRTFIQSNMPIPVHGKDTWFDPSTEEHYVATGVIIPQMTFGHDDGGNLCVEENDDYQFEINADGELMVLVVNEEAEQIILDNNIDFSIVDDCIYANGLWKKIDNIAFSRLRISVDGITAEVQQINSDVYDPNTGESKIEQNSTRIAQNAEEIELTAQSVVEVSGDVTKITNGTTAVPYVETSSIKIKNDKIEIKSTGDVDIKADKFSIAFNTAGHLANTSRVEISDDSGIKVSDQYGNYFQATSEKIGLYDIQNNARLYINNTGHAFFNGDITLGGDNNVNGALYVKNSSGNNVVVADKDGIGINNAGGTKIVELNSNGIKVWNNSRTAEQFYIDGNTGNATFAGTLNAAGGTFSGEVQASGIRGTKSLGNSWEINFSTGSMTIGNISANNITSGTLSVDRIGSNSVTVNKLTGEITNNNWKIDLTNGTFTIGNISANNITTGTLSADRIGANSISVAKLTGSIANGNWTINLNDGTFTIGNISASNITTGTMSANYISGGTLTLGGNNNTSGTLVINNTSNTKIGEWNNGGISIWNSSGTIKQFYVDSKTGNATFSGKVDVGGTDNGTITMKNSSNNLIGEWNKDKIILYSGGNFENVNGDVGTWISEGNIIVYNNNSSQARLQISANEYGGVVFYTNVNSGNGDHNIFFSCKSPTSSAFNYHKGTIETISDTLSLSAKECYLRVYKSNSSTDDVFFIYGNGFSYDDKDAYTLYIYKPIIMTSSLRVTGTKSRIVSTSQYSDRLLYCYETPSPMFGDVGEGQISQDGKCYIPLDAVFAQTISTDQYQVFLQKYGEGDCYVSERHGSYFVVSGTPNMQFGWELKAKQSDFDQLRLERNDEKFAPPVQTYGEEAASHIEEIRHERLPEESEGK